MFIAYQFLGFLLIPIIKFNIYLRIFKYKEDKYRYFERYGISKIIRPKGKLIWIHAASVGEFKSASTIINKLYKKYNILVTTTTLTASSYAIANFGNKIIHQYAPFDVYIWVNRFLNKWNPSLILWIESDLWPTTLNLIKKRSIKSFLINSRISPSSFNRWKYVQGFFKKITYTFDEIFAQSQLDKQRLEFLTKRKINFIGNLKLSSIEKLNDKIEFTKIQKKINNNKVLMIASTHEGEEKILINFIKKIILKYKKLKIIIAPRHPLRSQSIIKMLIQKKITSNLFDNSKNFDENVLIINSFGKMALYYSLSDIVILGGSFTRMGGHNPVEPAYNNCVVITGPHIYNWENVFLDMIKDHSCILCKNIKELEKIVNKLLLDNNKIRLFKKKAREYSSGNFFEIEKLISKIDNYFNESKC